MRLTLVLTLAFASLLPCAALSQRTAPKREPIIDVHGHAYSDDHPRLAKRTRKAAMDERRFWQLIEDAVRAAPGHDMDAADRQAAALEANLASLPGADINAFQRILDAKRNLAFRWDLWGAAYLMNGGCSDDCFDYFRGWLIGRGRKVFEAAIRDPDSLAEFAADPAASEPHGGARECERFLSVARVAYRRVAGREMPDTDVPFVREPVGKRWEEDGLPKLLPGIARRMLGTR